MESNLKKNYDNKFIDLIRIHEHINTNNEIGENLILTYYDKVKNLRPYKDIHNPNNNWKNVINNCVEALNLSKDFNITCWLLEALTYEENLYGFYLGLEIITILIKNFPNCYPENHEDKIMGFEWINNYIFEWIINEEILPQGTFQMLHLDLLNNKFNRELLKKFPYKEDFINDKLFLISKINNLLDEIGNYKPYLQNIINLLNKLETFYKTYIKEYSLIDKTVDDKNLIIKNHNKEDIFNEINNLTIEGLKIDKNDMILYIIHRVILLRKKPVNEILKLIRINELSNLFD